MLEWCWSRSNMSHNFLDNQSGQGNPPVQVDGRDDLTGEPLVQRDDDKPEAVRARLQDSSTMIVSDCEWFMKNIEPFHLCLHQPNWKEKYPFCKRKQTRWCNPFTFIWGVWQPDLALVTVLQGHGGIEVNFFHWSKACDDSMCGKTLPCYRKRAACIHLMETTFQTLLQRWGLKYRDIFCDETWNFPLSNSDRIEDLMPFMRRALMFFFVLDGRLSSQISRYLFESYKDIPRSTWLWGRWSLSWKPSWVEPWQWHFTNWVMPG